MGVLAARSVVVGLDPHDRDEGLNVIAQRCELAGLVVQQSSWLARLQPEVRERLRWIVSLESTPTPGVTTLEELLGGTGDKPELDALAVHPDDPATIIFTSGTTGVPKGISYTHRQVIQALVSILEAFPEIGADTRLACWLPLSNLFQRIINAAAIGCGAQTFYVEDPRAIMRHVGTIEPHLFIGVPRFYEKLYAGMMEKVGQAPAWQRSLVAWALQVGDVHASLVRSGGTPSVWGRWTHALADRIVLRRLRSIMGANLRFLVSGSAPMPRWLLERFHAMGLLILEAYGLSENVIPVAMNRLNAYRFGTVGLALRGSEVRVAKDGELLVRGPGVFKGYLGEERRDAQVDSDGYLASGDYATVDGEGFITLTGRKSEVFKTSTGRRIAPASIESALRQLPYVEHAAVFGAGRPFLVAVIVVGVEQLRALAGCDPEKRALTVVCGRIRKDFAPGLASLVEYQRPAGAVVTTRPLGVESGELTSNLKMRRHHVEARFAEDVEALYRLLERANGAPVQVESSEGQVLLCSL